jgi:lipoprotein-anchoring transpeptidase ErfK/SrfK
MALTGPTKSPKHFGFKSGDYHLVVNDASETMKCFDFTGKKLWEIPALAKGTSGADWRYTGADTPVGVYKIGDIYRDIETGHRDPAYGHYTFDMISLWQGEITTGRSGICIHGGGSALGWDGSWAPYQPLLPTHGCIRLHNQDLKDKILPLCESGGTVFVSVWQDNN